MARRLQIMDFHLRSQNRRPTLPSFKLLFDSSGGKSGSNLHKPLHSWEMEGKKMADTSLQTTSHIQTSSSLQASCFISVMNISGITVMSSLKGVLTPPIGVYKYTCRSDIMVRGVVTEIGNYVGPKREQKHKPLNLKRGDG